MGALGSPASHWHLEGYKPARYADRAIVVGAVCRFLATKGLLLSGLAASVERFRLTIQAMHDM